MTFSYKSDKKAVREGPVDMGATLQLETEPEKRVNCPQTVVSLMSPHSDCSVTLEPSHRL